MTIQNFGNLIAPEDRVRSERGDLVAKDLFKPKPAKEFVDLAAEKTRKEEIRVENERIAALAAEAAESAKAARQKAYDEVSEPTKEAYGPEYVFASIRNKTLLTGRKPDEKLEVFRKRLSNIVEEAVVQLREGNEAFQQEMHDRVAASTDQVMKEAIRDKLSSQMSTRRGRRQMSKIRWPRPTIWPGHSWTRRKRKRP